MAKHVFDLSEWGSFCHFGLFVKETQHTVTVVKKVWGEDKETRRNKSVGTRIIECDDPSAIVAAFEGEWRSHDSGIEAARQELARLKADQRRKSLEAVDRKAAETLS